MRSAVNAGHKEPSANLTQAAYEGLRADLLACRIPPGKKLKIQELCDRLSVSLGAIREALSRLTSEGLVVAEPQRGLGDKNIVMIRYNPKDGSFTAASKFGACEIARCL